MSAAHALRTALQHHRAGRLAEAEVTYREVLRLEPENAEALHLLGMLCQQSGRNEEAIQLLRKAVELRPDAAIYRSNLAGILGKGGLTEEAATQAREAIRLWPDFPEGHHNLALALQALGRLSEAESAYRRAIELRPAYPQAHDHLGNVLRKLGRLDQAVESHRQAIRLRPNYAKAYSNLAASLAERGWLEDALDALRKEVASAPDSPAAHSALLYALHYHPDYDRAALFREHLEWDRRHGQPLSKHIRPLETDGTADRRLRLGYVSPDLRDHTVPRFIGHAIERHDLEQFEIFCYSDAKQPDSVTERLRSHSDGWRDTHALNDEGLASLIREDRIDVLVDLRGHGPANRLPVFARRPAPVQVNVVGYFDTTGLAAIDYRVTDEIQDPSGSEQFHTEKLIRLPAGCWCYRVSGDEPPVGALPALQKGHVTFGSLNKLIKLTPVTAALWARILGAVPKSRLLLAVSGTDTKGIAPAWLSRLGLPLDRVDIVGKTRTRTEYLSRFNQIDIGLDTFPFSGITTTCDGLWMGVPAVTLAGSTSVSRAGASILSAVGLSELVASEAEAYVGAAVALASDLDRVARLRTTLRDRMESSDLTNGRRFTGDFQAALRDVWRMHCLAR